MRLFAWQSVRGIKIYQRNFGPAPVGLPIVVVLAYLRLQHPPEELSSGSVTLIFFSTKPV
jgi:hypothetical protein